MSGTVAGATDERTNRLLRVGGGPAQTEGPPSPAAALTRAGPPDDGRRGAPRLTVAPSLASARCWDAFAQACDASFWSSRGGAWMWQFKLHARFRLRFFDLILTMPTGERCKIGQCAVGLGPRLRVIADGLTLKPDYADLWPVAMESLLGHLGPGRYVYGSFWSTEVPRHRAILRLPHTRVVAVRRLVVEAIDLKRAERWSDFLGRVSRNIVRNARGFHQAHADRRFIVRHGVGCLTLLPKAIRLRRRMYDRKRIAFSQTRAVVSYVMRSLLLRRYVLMRVTVAGRRVLASAGTVAFGESVSFLDGASAPTPAGAGWDVLLHAIEDAHRSGRTRFQLGYTDVTDEFDGGDWVSPVRYRRDCRARAIETSLFAFDFAVEGAGDRSIPPVLLERTDPCWTGEARA